MAGPRGGPPGGPPDNPQKPPRKAPNSNFNYRNIANTGDISKHAYEFAIDINPFQNPYIEKGKAFPEGARYNPKIPGTLTENHPIVKKFLELGWKWGGNWKSVKDYQHFQKTLD